MSFGSFQITGSNSNNSFGNQSEPSQSFLQRNALKVAELHLDVPVHKWCVTLEDVLQFESGVREAWLGGEIENNPESHNPTHDDPRFGPNMYQVTELFIKPKTRRAGHTSWALMLHPAGLNCDVFVTHAWAEGIFEFARKVKMSWPRQARHLWCCFLSNPQNADISALLEGSVMQSPFALAISSAKYMMVLPNHKCSIYTRLWCVLEAKLAMEMELTIVLPAAVPVAKLSVFLAPGTLVGVSAFALSGEWVHHDYKFTFLSSCQLACLIVSFLVRFLRTSNVCLRTCAEEAIVGTIMGVWALHEYLNFYKWSWESFKAAFFGFDPYLWSLLFQLTTVSLALKVNVFNQIHNVIVKGEAQQLYFTSVRQAACSSHADEERIRDAILNQEDSIDKMINVFRRTGYYDSMVHEDVVLGFDPAEGFAFSYTKLLATCTVYLCTLNSGCSSPLRALYFRNSIAFRATFFLLPAIACVVASAQRPRQRRSTFALISCWHAALILAGIVVIFAPHFSLWTFRDFSEVCIPFAVPIFILAAPRSSLHRRSYKGTLLAPLCVLVLACLLVGLVVFIFVVSSSYQRCLSDFVAEHGMSLGKCLQSCQLNNYGKELEPSCYWCTNTCLEPYLSRLFWPFIILYALVVADVAFEIVRRSDIHPMLIDGVQTWWSFIRPFFKPLLRGIAAKESCHTHEIELHSQAVVSFQNVGNSFCDP